MTNITKYQSNFLNYLILSLCLIIPFNNDVYVPALPDIARSLATTHAQWVMSICLLGIALSQLFYGPLLDRFGRKPVIIVGLSIFIIGSLLAVIAPSIESLLIARFVQAIGACCSIASVLAIIRDVYSNQEVVKMTALIMGIIAICPTIAPVIGNGLQLMGGWRACFMLLLVMGIFYLLLTGFFLQETHHNKNLQALEVKHLYHNYRSLVQHKHFLGFVLTSCFSYASIFCYFAAAPFLLIDLLHISTAWIGLIIAINAIPLLVISYIVAKIASKINLAKAILLGSIIIFLGAVLMVLINLWVAPSLLSLAAPMFISSIGIGIIRPSASAGAIQLVEKKIAGSASAMFSFFSFIGAAFFTTLTALFSYHAILPFALLLMLLGCCCVMSALLAQRTEALDGKLITAFESLIK